MSSPSLGCAAYDSDCSGVPARASSTQPGHGPAEMTEEEAEAIAAYESYFHTERGILI